MWCRSCGLPQSVQAGPCRSCATQLASGPPAESPVGLVYPIRSKIGLGQKHGICVDVEGNTLVLHMSAREKAPVRIPSTAAPDGVVPAGYSAATRLLMAAGLSDGRFAWDRDVLRQRALDLCGDIRAVRRLYDEALVLGWDHVVSWAPLTASEKAWRAAHHAATVADATALRVALTALPGTGYLDRTGLLIPFLPEIRRDPAAWKPILSEAKTVRAERVDLITMSVEPGWDAALRALAGLLPDSHAREWFQLCDQLHTGSDVGPPSSREERAWAALSILSATDRGTIDDQVDQLRNVDLTLLDDLVDSGRITAAVAERDLPPQHRAYFAARLNPDVLSDGDLSALGHVDEVARRYVLRRQLMELDALAREGRVPHFQALGKLACGAEGPLDDLEPESRSLLDEASAALSALKDGRIAVLPARVASDPSLWSLYAEVAADGRLRPDPSRPVDDPLNIWVALHRLMGLIWTGEYAEAARMGTDLLVHLSDERTEDEARNMQAYALYQTGRIDDAVQSLAAALQGEYTENLLVNASIVASDLQPEAGLDYLTKLVGEAPTAALRRSALKRAIILWRGTERPFPTDLKPALENSLAERAPISEHLFLGDVALSVDPQILLKVRNPGGELAEPHKMLVAEARFRVESTFSWSDLAKALVSVHQGAGRPDWFNDRWSELVKVVTETVFVDFGQAMGSASFVDAILVSAPDLFTPVQRYLLSPQAGAHMSVGFAEDDSFLTDHAWSKFFLRPIEEFLSTRHTLEESLVDRLASNFTLCAGVAAMAYMKTRRSGIAASYNALVGRLRWDSQNASSILDAMRGHLAEAEGAQLLLDRVVDRMRRLASTEDERVRLTRDLGSEVADWRAEIVRLRADL